MLLATINLPKSLTFLRIFFVKVSKSIIYLLKSFLGKFYRHLAIFFWSHWSYCSLRASQENNFEFFFILLDFAQNVFQRKCCHSGSGDQAHGHSSETERVHFSVTRLGDFFCFLGKHSKLVATIILPKLLTLLDNFCKGVNIINFSTEIIFGQLL